jgi:hypothetical protein
MIQASPEIHTRIRLQLGVTYSELMYYVEEAENAQLAIDCFEWVLERSKEKEELTKASDGKAQAWFWKLTAQEKTNIFAKDEDFPFRMWLKSAIMLDRDNVTAICYRALSGRWISGDLKADLVWFHLASSLLRAKNRPSPPGFYYRYSSSLYTFASTKSQVEDGRFMDLPTLLSALEYLELFVSRVTLKDLYVIQRLVMIHSSLLLLLKMLNQSIRIIDWRGFEKIYPSRLNANQWHAWRDKFIDSIIERRRNILESIAESCGDRVPIGSNAYLGESEEAFRATLEARIVRPRNLPL